jgi:general secretion pathway protein D
MRRPLLTVALAGLAMALLLAGCGREPARRPLGQAAPTASAPPPQVAAPTPVASQPMSQDESTPAQRNPKIAEIYPGTGRMVNRGAGTTPALRERQGDITLNFTDTDIREVAAVVLRDLLGVNYVIDPTVRGTVTLQTGAPLARADLIPVLEAVLAANGAVLVQQGGVYRVAPAGAAGRGGGAVGFGSRAGAGGYQLAVLPLNYIGAGEMLTILEPLFPEGTVRADPERGLIVVNGSSNEIQLARDTISVFDVDQLAGSSVLLESLRVADAKTVAVELDNIFGDLTKGPLAGAVRIIPVERLNALIVIAQQPRYLDEARNWIARLDRGQAPNERKLYVYYAQNGKAASLTKSLRGILQEGGGALTEVGDTVTPTRTGSVPTAQARTYQTPGQLESELASRLPGGAAGASTANVPSLAAEPPRTGAAAGTGIRIMADDANNAVLVLATAQEYADIEEVLLKLDLRPLQVLIEASIIEVSLQDQLRFGVQFFLDSGGLNIADDGSTFLTSGLNSLIAPNLPGFAFTLTGGGDPRLVIDALSQLTDVKMISSPQLLVLDNQSAQLQVGDQVPIITQQSTGNLVGDTRTVNSVEYRETGVTLNITPRVNASGLVTLEIAQEVSDVAQTTSSGIDSPTFQQRKIISTVAVSSGQTLALGGLIREVTSDGRSGLPILSDLPYVGPLFGTTTNDSRRTELLVMLTPRVIRTQEEAQDVTADLRRQFKAVLDLEATGTRRPRRMDVMPKLFN